MIALNLGSLSVRFIHRLRSLTLSNRLNLTTFNFSVPFQEVLHHLK